MGSPIGAILSTFTFVPGIRPISKKRQRRFPSPMFAVARMVGWSAHRLEELMNCDKIIRPAYQSVAMDKEYVPMKDRIIVE